MLKVAVITVSDRASKGEYKDLSGPKIKQIIEESRIESEMSMSMEKNDFRRQALKHPLFFRTAARYL